MSLTNHLAKHAELSDQLGSAVSKRDTSHRQLADLLAQRSLELQQQLENEEKHGQEELDELESIVLTSNKQIQKFTDAIATQTQDLEELLSKAQDSTQLADILKMTQPVISGAPEPAASPVDSSATLAQTAPTESSADLTPSPAAQTAPQESYADITPSPAAQTAPQESSADLTPSPAAQTAPQESSSDITPPPAQQESTPPPAAAPVTPEVESQPASGLKVVDLPQ